MIYENNMTIVFGDVNIFKTFIRFIYLKYKTLKIII